MSPRQEKPPSGGETVTWWFYALLDSGQFMELGERTGTQAELAELMEEFHVQNRRLLRVLHFERPADNDHIREMRRFIADNRNIFYGVIH